MTLNEFKAWLEGFAEAIDGAPTEVQWKKLREKIKEIHPEEVKAAPLTTILCAPNPYGTGDPQWPYDRTIVVSGGSTSRIWNGTTWTAWNNPDVPYTLT